MVKKDRTGLQIALSLPTPPLNRNWFNFCSFLNPPGHQRHRKNNKNIYIYILNPYPSARLDELIESSYIPGKEPSFSSRSRAASFDPRFLILDPRCLILDPPSRYHKPAHGVLHFLWPPLLLRMMIAWMGDDMARDMVWWPVPPHQPLNFEARYWQI